MAIPVPFGQYYPAESPVHRLDARAKLGVTTAFTVALFAVGTWSALGAAAAVVGVAVIWARVPVRLVARGLKPVLWLLGFTILANGLRWDPAEALVRLGPLAVDEAGVLRGGFFALRVLLLVMGTSLVTLTTSPVALTDALTSLMRPLRAVRFPADDVAMMLSIALRFVPTTAEEAERIVVAQAARGARFEEGGIVRRSKAWVPVLVPLFVRLFRRADDLAIAMESRCYTGVGRTRLREPVMRATDWMVLVSGVTLAVLGAWFL